MNPSYRFEAVPAAEAPVYGGGSSVKAPIREAALAF